MLHNTLKTISCSSSLATGNTNADDNEDGLNTSNLYEVQMKLANEELEKRRLDTDKYNSEQEVSKYQKKIEELEPDIKREEKRQALQHLVELYQIKRVLLNVEEAKSNRATKQKQVELAEQELHDNQVLIEPIVQREREAKREVALAEKRYIELNKKCSGTNTKIINSRENVIKCDSNLETIRQEIQLISQRSLRLEDDLKRYRNDEAQLQEVYESALSTVENANIPNQIKEYQSNTKSLIHSCEETRTDIHELNQNKADLQQHFDQYRKQLNSIQDPKHIFHNRLNSCRESWKTKEASKAMAHLTKNEDRLRQQGKLRGVVYGPIAYYCKVEDPTCAAMLESAVGTYKLMNFVVTSNEDKKSLQQEFRNNHINKIDIAVVHDTSDLGNRLNHHRSELNRLNVSDSLGVKGLVSCVVGVIVVVVGVFVVFVVVVVVVVNLYSNIHCSIIYI